MGSSATWEDEVVFLRFYKICYGELNSKYLRDHCRLMDISIHDNLRPVWGPDLLVRLLI